MCGATPFYTERLVSIEICAQPFPKYQPLWHCFSIGSIQTDAQAFVFYFVFFCHCSTAYRIAGSSTPATTQITQLIFQSPLRKL